MLANDTDEDLPNDTLTVNTTPVSGPTYGTLTLYADGTFSYTHDGSQNFSDSFTYEVTDAVGHQSQAVVSISVLDSSPLKDMWRFDFNGFGGHTETGYTGVSPFQAKDGNAFGWVGTLPWYFERFAASDPGWDKLRYDGQSTNPMGDPLQFQVDVVDNQTYEVMILTGDAAWNHDRESFTVTGWPSAGDASTDSEVVDVWGAGAPDGSGVQVTWGGGTANPSPGYYRWVRLTVTVGDGEGDLGTITLDMADLGGGSGTTVILAMDVRPLDAVGKLTLARAEPGPQSPTGGPPPSFTALAADGMTVDRYTGTGAPPNAVLTVTVSAEGRYATVTPDAVPAADLPASPSTYNAYVPTFGGQVKAKDDGSFEFFVLRPATLTDTLLPTEDWTVTVEESSGLSRGTAIQPYEAPSDSAPLRFDFGTATSPVQEDFLPMVPQTIYSAIRGYGWKTRVAAGDRRDPNLGPLRTDFNSGRNATFSVDLPNGDYHVRLYHSNPLYFGSVPYSASFFTVDVEGTSYDVDPASGYIDPGETYIHTVEVTVSDGRLDILFGVNSTAFMIAGIDISRGTLPAESPPTAWGDPLAAGEAPISLAQFQPVVAEARPPSSDAADGGLPLGPDNHHPVVLADPDADPEPEHPNNLWTGAGDGTSWTGIANWSLGRVPTAEENAIIDLPGEHTVTVPYTTSARSTACNSPRLWSSSTVPCWTSLRRRRSPAI